MVDTLSGEYQTLTGSLEAAVRPMAHMPGRTVHSPSADPMTDRLRDVEQHLAADRCEAQGEE